MEFFILRKQDFSHSRTMLTVVWTAAAVLSVLLTGCNGSDGPAMVPIKGEVTYNGTPLTHGRVVYMPKDPTTGRQANGPIKPDGTFELTTQNAGDGARHGEYHIVVFSRGNEPGKSFPSREEAEAARNRNTQAGIPEKFMDHRTSGLTDTVSTDHSGFKKIELVD